MDNTGVQRMYVKLKESISLKLIRLEIAEEEEIAAPKKPGLFNCFKKKEEVKDKRFKLNWQASYTENRSIFTPVYRLLGLNQLNREKSYSNSLNRSSITNGTVGSG